MSSNAIVQSRSGLFSKVSLLLAVSMILSAAGTFVGTGITSLAGIIVLGILFIAGAIAVPFAAAHSKGLGLVALGIWTFISGLFLGPTINAYVTILGWQTVFMAYLGTGAVMAVCGAVGALSGFNFSSLGKWLTIALLILIVVGIVNIFVGFGHFGTLLYAGVGMLLFAGFFIFDFFRLANSEDNWFNAIELTMSIYLDYINFLLYFLRFLAEMAGKKD